MGCLTIDYCLLAFLVDLFDQLQMLFNLGSIVIQDF